MTFNYGETISVELSEYLKEFTGKDDRALVNEKTGISVSTLRDLTYRTNAVTENNEIGIIELMKIAIQNAENNIHRATQCKIDLTEILDCV